MIEVYKTVQNINPSFMKEIFVRKDITHNLRNNLPMHIPKARTSSYGIESLIYLGCKLWNNLPDHFKALKLLHHLKGKLKDVKIAAAAGYAENSLIMSASLINSIDLYFILHLYSSFTSLLLCKYITISLYYFAYGSLKVLGFN